MKYYPLIFLCIVVLFHHSFTDTNPRQAVLQQLLNQSLYDSKTPPINLSGQPVIVTVSIFIRNIEALDEMKMEYKLQITLRQGWNDPRLSYSNVTLTSLTVTSEDILARIWTPDLTFSNEKEARIHNIMKPNILLKINSAGDMLLSSRLSLTLSCPMNLRFFPLDKQACSVLIESYAYTNEVIHLKWREEIPIEIAPNLTMSNFRVKEVRNTFYSRTTTTIGAFSGLEQIAFFEREFSYHFIQIYLPCGMIVMVSWVSFWLGENAIDARVSLGITTVLTMVTQIYGISQNTPPVSYVKAIDVWTGSCLMFVIMTIIEVSAVRSYSENRKQKDVIPFYDWHFKRTQPCNTNLDKSIKIDTLSKFMFPVAFVLFNIAYWSAYLLSPQNK